GAQDASRRAQARRAAARHQRSHAALQAGQDACGRHRGAGRPHGRSKRMSNVGITQMLAEMQRLAGAAGVQAPESAQAADATGFAELLKASIDGVNKTQAAATEMAAALERGDPN